MLDHVAGDHEIKLPEIEITIDQRVNKRDARIRALSDLNTTRRRINSGDAIAECSEPPRDVTVAASEIADRLHAVELLHEVDKHARKLLARLAVPRALGAPFELCVRRRFVQ